MTAEVVRVWRCSPRLPRRLVTITAIAGPGLIAANAGNDAAGIATYASAGSQYRYDTLFFMLLVTAALIMVQEMAVRLGATTGKGLAALIREQFSLRLASLALVCLVLANTGLVVSEFAGIGAAFSLLGVDREIAIPVTAVMLWVLVVFGSYQRAQRVFLVLSLAFLAYPVAMVLGRPNWSSVGSHLVVPHLHASSAFLLLGVALIGTTVSPYMQFYAAAGVVDRDVSPPLRHLRADAIVGAVFACLVSITIIVATGTAIGGTGPLRDAAHAALALRPAAGSGAATLFAVGLIGASALAAAVVPLSTSYAVGETIGVERSVSRRFSQAPLFLGLFSAQIVLGAAVAMTPINVISLLIGSQVLQGLISPVVLVFILVLANRRSLLGEAANGRVYRIAATVVVLGIATMSTLLLAQTVAGWL
ncbi:MAG TPA: divalent metal cation transporter [Micromonosporaceae bacterium]